MPPRLKQAEESNKKMGMKLRSKTYTVRGWLVLTSDSVNKIAIQTPRARRSRPVPTSAVSTEDESSGDQLPTPAATDQVETSDVCDLPTILDYI